MTDMVHYLLEGDTAMMQPTDIRSHNFGKGLFGYKKTDVDQYVDTVYRAYDELFTENKKLRDEKEALVKELNMLKYEMEKSGSDDSAKAEPAKEEKKEEVKTETKVEDPFEDVFEDTSSSSNGKIKMTSSKKDDEAEKKEDESATSKFFQQDSSDDIFGGDGDDVFVGEIEEARKPNKVMIGDGEEESDDFEFL
jgi:DivIVA domain